MSTAGETESTATVAGQSADLSVVARRLAADHTFTRPGGRFDLAHRLDEQAALLDSARKHFANPTDPAAELSSAAEWLLDNYYLILRAIREVRQDLPEGFLRQLPTLASDPPDDVPRVYALARELCRSCVLNLEPGPIRRFVAAYQAVTTLSMGELWALPTMLRLATLEYLGAAVGAVIERRPKSRAAAADRVNGPRSGAAGSAGRVDTDGRPDRPTASGEAAPRLGLEEDATVAAAILSLRALDLQNWREFFERSSGVERILRLDPARIYGRMDFGTRDRYRKAVEHLARMTGASEETVARQAIDLAGMPRRASSTRERAVAGEPQPARAGAGAAGEGVGPAYADPSAESSNSGGRGGRLFGERHEHVGFYLLDLGRPDLELRLGFASTTRTRLRQWLEGQVLAAYLGTIAVLSMAIVIGLAGLVLVQGGTANQVAVTALLVVVPALTVVVSVVHSIVPRLVPAHRLPKLEFRGGIPVECSTLVAIPALLTSANEVRSLLRQLEQHYLSTRDTNLYFALLTDFADAPQQHTPGDDELVTQAREGIYALNRRYGNPPRTPFHLCHRDRQWNPGERVWMGWERKRGKLIELLDLLSGGTGSSYTPDAIASLPVIRFVVTLDADSVLTRGAIRRLVATLAHPLNQAEIDSRTGSVVAGYTVLQPRVLVKPTSVNQTIMTRVFAGDPGLDLYSEAVSDVYQDLFGEGIYVGKGIVDVAAFRRSLAGRVPENALLSHDLLEGILGRAGLVSDVVVLEEFPAHYLAFTERAHRWIRGDWQLLPWLLPRVPTAREGAIRTDLSALDRWKILDNLRRSLLAPTMVALLVAAWLWLPGSALLWTAIVACVPGVAVLSGMLVGFRLLAPDTPWVERLRPPWVNLARWALALVFLPWDAWRAVDAIWRTLVRLAITRRGLLQWVPAAHIARAFGHRGGPGVTWRAMAPALVLAMGIGALVALVRLPALAVAGPLVVAWSISPQIAQWISRPRPRRRPRLTAAQQQVLRGIARRTWLFYERFVGPEDHWLPPDHYEEWPREQVAHRTSPSNIGFLLTSTVAAADLGYIGLPSLTLRLGSTLATLGTMERYRGHFLNWYDTTSLAPLSPRYVSTVDSGNLAGCLIAVARACVALPDQHVLPWQRWQGLLDTIALLDDVVRPLDVGAAATALRAELADLERQVRAIAREPDRRSDLLARLSDGALSGVDRFLVQLVSSGSATLTPTTVNNLRLCSERVRHHLVDMRRDMDLLLPWVVRLNEPPGRFADTRADAALESAWRALVDALPDDPRLRDIPAVCRAGEEALAALRRLVEERRADQGRQVDRSGAGGWDEAGAWCAGLHTDLRSARTSARKLMGDCRRLGTRSDRLVEEMDFGCLFDRRRQVFHVGYSLVTQKLDDHHYDLLASEARLASFVAIAKRDVSQQHWLHLGRPLTRLDQQAIALLSWSGTMFEHLMPPLLMKSYDDTLLDQSSRAVVRRQIAYARQHGVPWGISESGYYAFDASLEYQYRAFGVPGLGLDRAQGGDLVVAPYASMMAVAVAPEEVLENYRRFQRLGMVGQFGLYEAIDFTPSRLAIGQSHARVQSYMSHHQGMTLLALTNCLHDEVMVRRFHSDPHIQSVELLLQEQIPSRAPIQAATNRVTVPNRPVARPVRLTPWSVPVRTATPQVHHLSNGRYAVMITNAGAGYSEWEGVALTRWRADSTLDDWGTWIHLEDRDTGARWSASARPIAAGAAEQQARFHAHKAVFRTRADGLALKLEVAVAPADDLEVRDLVVTNDSDRPLRLAVASYAEVVLAPQDADRRHPAFSKLFIEAEFLPDLNALVFHRRPRSPEDAPVYLLHMLIAGAYARGHVAHACDRDRVVARNGSLRAPSALPATGADASSAACPALDPIMALGRDLDLAPRSTGRLAFVTAAGRSRADVLALAVRYRALLSIDGAIAASQAMVRRDLRGQGLSTTDLRAFDQLLSALLYPDAARRSDTATLAANTLGQSSLWGVGISGDYPILLLRLNSEVETPLVHDVLRAHAYWRRRGITADLVIMVTKSTGYTQELQGELYRLMHRMQASEQLNQRGGVFLLSSDRMADADRILLETVARVVLDGSRGTLAEQLKGPAGEPGRLPAFVPTLGTTVEAAPTPDVLRPTDLHFDNGRGGFGPDGREYKIHLAPGEHTPRPWINVIANAAFGFIVSESGAGHTWSENSAENRLTPWSNDPVRDTPGEALYLRDEETAEVWSPTPGPTPANAAYLVRHGAGYTIFEHGSHGLRQDLRMFVAPDSPVKLIVLRLENQWDRPRRLTATYYAQWVLGVDPESTNPYVIPEYDPQANALLARNPYQMEFGGRVAFLAASRRPHSFTCDRTEFLGRAGDVERPAGLTRVGLAGAAHPGLDPCAALQLHVELAPGEAKEVAFVLGQGADREEAIRLADRFTDPIVAEAAWRGALAQWEEHLGAVEVTTPDSGLDLLVNRWLPYQTLACRVWGRSALYQSGGAFGFRDQLQDVMALVHAAPAIARDHLLLAAQHQFEAGDVLHWWHPPSARGVRTRCSDDLLWLPFVTAHYVAATGDAAVLGEAVTFLAGEALRPGERERYDLYGSTAETATLYEHCRRALVKGSTAGPHGLPLMGGGDWNDGLDRVGSGGIGESIWLGWFLHATLTRFAPVCELMGQAAEAAACRERADAVRAALEVHSWDGAWYRRAFYDDGEVLGSARSDEWQIDSVAQSWAVLSGAANPARADGAMRAVQGRLVDFDRRLVLLSAPPFDKTLRDPGYVKGYPPGVRENGGVYVHAAVWAVWALAELGRAQEAHALFHMLSPIDRSGDPAGVEHYRVEPYVVAGDIAGVGPGAGTGGWTWYTGSAAWMYRLALEAFLGVRRSGRSLRIAPCIPSSWSGYAVRYRYGRTVYHVVVRNPHGVQQRVREVRLDGQVLGDGCIPLTDDGSPHAVEVLMG